MAPPGETHERTCYLAFHLLHTKSEGIRVQGLARTPDLNVRVRMRDASHTQQLLQTQSGYREHILQPCKYSNYSKTKVRGSRPKVSVCTCVRNFTPSRSENSLDMSVEGSLMRQLLQMGLEFRIPGLGVGRQLPHMGGVTGIRVRLCMRTFVASLSLSLSLVLSLSACGTDTCAV